MNHLSDVNFSKESDEMISFSEEGHLYFAHSNFLKQWVSSKNGGGSAPLLSTTTILKQYFKGTDFDKLAIRVFRNQKNQILMKSSPDFKYYGCENVEDIKKIWSEGAKLGTEMHNRFENMANLFSKGGHIDVKSIVDFNGRAEDVYFQEFIELLQIDGKRRSFWRTEFKMWHDILHISGTIDALLYDHEKDTYIIVDYKRLKNGLTRDPLNPKKSFKDLSSSSKGRILPSFLALRNNGFSNYGCQLNLYKHLFEKMYPSRKISALYLVVVNSTKIEEGGALEICEVPLEKFDKNIEEVFKSRAESILSACGHKLPMNLHKEIVKYVPHVELDSTSIFSDEE